MMYLNPITLYRVARYLSARHLGLVSRVVDALNLVLFASVVPPTADIGEGTICEHRGLGVVIHPQAIIGRDCHILPQVTIGGRTGRDGAPRLGHGVLVGVGAKVLGPITIGDGARIGANAVVLQDVPPGWTAVGNPARLIEPRN